MDRIFVDFLLHPNSKYFPLLNWSCGCPILISLILEEQNMFSFMSNTSWNYSFHFYLYYLLDLSFSISVCLVVGLVHSCKLRLLAIFLAVLFWLFSLYSRTFSPVFYERFTASLMFHYITMVYVNRTHFGILTFVTK